MLVAHTTSMDFVLGKLTKNKNVFSNAFFYKNLTTNSALSN